VLPLEALLEEASRHIAAGERAAAVDAYRRAVAQAPGRADLHHNLGALQADAGEGDAALRAFSLAAGLNSAWAEPWLAMGHVHYRQGRYPAAAAAFEAALLRAPDRLDGCYNAARAQIGAKRWSLALPHLERARALAPANEDVWFELRAVLLLLNREDDAAADLRRFAAVAPPSARTVVAALRAAFRDGDAESEKAALERALRWPYAAADAELVAEVLALVQYADVAPVEILALYRAYDRLQQARRAGLPPCAGPRRGDDPRIRIGYLSADFREHVMGRLLLPVVRAHDAGRFAVRAYALAPP
jgi:protein O-GlcNAc transferase